MALRTKLNPMGANGDKYYTLTVTTSPANATCVLTYDGVAHTAKTATVKSGTVVSYSVSYSGYTTQTGSWTVTENTTKSITLTALYTLTVNCSYGSTYIYILDANGNQLASTYNTGTLSYSVTSGTVLKYYVRSSNSPGTSNTYSVTMNANHTATLSVSTSTTTKYQLDSDLQIVGSPSITSDGLMTNISANNYIATINDAASYMSETNYEIQVKFKFSTLSGRQAIIGNLWNSTQGRRGVLIEANGNTFLCNAGYNASTSAYNWSVSNALATNTWYTINFKNNNNTYTVDAGSIGTNSSTTRKTVWSTERLIYFGRQYGDSSHPAQYATIDLKNSWIKSNGSYVIYNVGTVTSYYWVHSIT